MVKSFAEILGLLPECQCDVNALARGAVYFGVTGEELHRAAVLLPENHDLKYKGVRLLLSACLEEFAALFSDGDREPCEVSVPAPPFVMYAFQKAGGDLRFASNAFFAQIVLRGILLCREPLSLNSCAKRRCGLNLMRRRLICQPPGKEIRRQLQFGLLCDECSKLGEQLGDRAECITVSFPKHAPREVLSSMAEEFLERACDSLDIVLTPEHTREAFLTYSRLMKAENELLRLNGRPDRLPLYGNSLALAQSVQIMTPDRPERFISALETLTEELKTAPSSGEEHRMYCFYVPFLRPEIDARFRKNGTVLLGNAAFLQQGKHMGLNLADMTAAWLCDMSIRGDTETECSVIAGAMDSCGCQDYLTGFFGFDRWLGANIPMQRKILRQQYGKTVKTLDADFWSENAVFGGVLDRIDLMCLK